MEMKIPKLGWLAKEKAAWEQPDPAGSRADRKARNREREKEMGWNTRGEKLLFYFSMSFLILWNGRTKTEMRQICNFREPQRDTISVLSSFVSFQLLSINILGG